MFGEINKMLEELEEYGLKWYDAMHLSYLIHFIWQIRALGVLDILTNFGNKLQKKKNLWVIYENIFLETAYRIENEIRDIIWFHNTYLHQATFIEDSHEKTDFKWYYQKDEKNTAHMIPVQITARAPQNFQHKLRDVEEFLKQHIYKENNKLPFLVINTQWDFPKTIIDEDLIDWYHQWQNNKEIREKQSSSKWFPFFIDTIDRWNIWPAKMVIVALHIIEELLHNSYKFSDAHKDYKWTIIHMKWVIRKKMNLEKNTVIDSIKLRKLKINIDSIEKKELGQWKHFFYGINFTIGYNWNQAGQITVYRK
jgi:hypothetical protein